MARRREAERFTRSVIAMRAETQSLEALLEVLSQRIEDSQASLTGMTEKLMRLGDETRAPSSIPLDRGTKKSPR